MNPQVLEYLSRHEAQALEELFALLRIKSISGDPAYRDDVRQAAGFVQQQFQQMGLPTELIETPGHPIVYAEWLHAPGQPTVLIYGHYDVQPTEPRDPANPWISEPFEPEIRDGKIYARGATDDKGQFFTHLKAVEAWLKTTGSLPVNVKFVIEGEEEVGSEHLDHFLASRRSALSCDVAVISDTSQYAPGIPAITYGLRGIVACEVSLTGPDHDLHSGVFGGSIRNPVVELARLVGQLHDDHGRIRLPGFYDAVVDLTPAERAEFAALPFDEAAYLKDVGSPSVFGEAGYTTLERRWARPTCEINGFFGGYTGAGPKTIVPSRATAKITCRLVPDQSPTAILTALEAFLRERCPPGVTLTFTSQHGGEPFVMPLSSPYLQAAQQAIAAGFGRPAVFIREGGSIPVVTTFRRVLGVDTLLLGWGQNTDNLHSPNEHFSVAAFHQGTRTSAALWFALAHPGG